jgi:prepilin-type N-terminal cleavage/methylation domain-containing protein
MKGYTLIEILIVLTIMSLLFNFGSAGFKDFSRRQALSGTAKNIQGDLRLAQANAATGQKPSGCTTTLDSYSFNVKSVSRYTIEANCVPVSPIVKDVSLPSGITISTPSPNPLKFKVLSQGTNLTDDWTLTLSQTGTNPVIVTVTPGGEIK